MCRLPLLTVVARYGRGSVALSSGLLKNGLRIRIEHVEVEAVGRQQRWPAGAHAGPSLICRTGDRGVQAEQKLAATAIDGRRLPEGQPQAHGRLQSHTGSGHVL